MQAYSKGFRTARRMSGTYGAIAAICGFVLALGLSLAIQRYFHFEFQDSSGIAGWISANKYPKQQETFYYLSALIFVPSFTILCWLFWVTYSTAISSLIRIPVQRILKQDALTYLPFLLIIGKFNQFELPVSKLFLLPVGLTLVSKIALLLYNSINTEARRTLFPEHKSLISGNYTDEESEYSPPEIHPGTSPKQDMRLKWEAVWSISASGLCIGFYILLGYIHKSPALLLLMAILSAATLGALAFSLIYSFIVSRLFKFRFHNILVYEAYSHIPAVLLLIFAVLYPNGKYPLLIIFLLSFSIIKLLFLFSNTCRGLVDRPEAGRSAESANLRFNSGIPLFQRLTAFLTIPALVYVFFYGGGNIHQGFDFFYAYDGIDLFHEGERLAPLNELLRGGIPFRDIYIQHGLFQNAFRPLLASALFGETLAAVRLLERLFVPIGYVAFYFLGLHIFRNRLTAVLALLIVSAQNFWVIDRHSLGLISIAFVASHITLRRNSGLPGGRQGTAAYDWKLILAGICTTLAFFYSTEIGLYSFAACVLFLLAYGFTQKDIPLRLGALPILYYGTGALIGFLPFALYFGWYSALDDLLRNSYIQCVYQISIWGQEFPELMGPLSEIKSLKDIPVFVLGETFRWYLPILIFLITATYLLYRTVQGRFWNSVSNARLLLLLLAGTAFFRTALGRSDSVRLIYGATFMWFISLFFLEGALLRAWRILSPAEIKRPSAHKAGLSISFRIMQAVLISIPIMIFFWYVASFHKPVNAAIHRLSALTQYGNIQRNVQETLSRAGGIQLPDDQVNQIQKVVKYIQSNTSPDEPIFDFSNQGGYYFFADRPSVTRYHQIAYASTINTQKEVIDALERTRTKLVIFKTGGWFDNIDGIPTTDRNPLIARYLDENYEEAVNINGTVILKRKDRQRE